MNGPGLIPRPLAYGLIVLIAALWGADVIASIVDQDHQLNTTLGTAFLVVAGLLGGLSRGRGGQGGDPAAPAEPAEPHPDAPDDGGDEPLPPDAVPFAEILARLQSEQADGRRHR